MATAVAIACAVIVVVSLIVLAVLAGGALHRAGRLTARAKAVRPEISRLRQSTATLRASISILARR